MAGRGASKAFPVDGVGRHDRPLPDVASQTRPDGGAILQKVGMSNVDIAIRRHDEHGHIVLTPAKADVFVSLDDPLVKGIHMSRLFLRLHEELERSELSPQLLDRLLHGFVESHRSMSRSAFINLSYDHLLKRSALLSDHSAWRHYPVSIQGSLVGGVVQHELSVRVTYSSTCPCSAALAKHLLRQQFEKHFPSEESIPARKVAAWMESDQMSYPTPHSQRSHADITVRVRHADVAFPINDLIDSAESALTTAVQTVVKRQDEQEFAKINGENLMFCEDAARRIREAIDPLDYVADYRIRVEHLESLHPHDAVAVVVRGVDGGLAP